SPTRSLATLVRFHLERLEARSRGRAEYRKETMELAAVVPVFTAKERENPLQFLHVEYLHRRRPVHRGVDRPDWSGLVQERPASRTGASRTDGGGHGLELFARP